MPGCMSVFNPFNWLSKISKYMFGKKVITIQQTTETAVIKVLKTSKLPSHTLIIY